MRRLLIALLAAVPCVLLLLPVFFIGAVLALIASTARAVGRMLEPRFVPWTELMTFEPDLGWKPRPNLDTHYLADHDDVFRVVTDGEGWPGRTLLDDSSVVVVGDSFAFGYGVDAGRSFADLDPASRTKAVGAPGYSMVHGVLLMERFGVRLAGKRVIWFVYLENDLQDNLAPEMRRYRAPFVRRDPATGRWGIVTAHVSAAPWECSDLDRRRLFPHMCVPGPIADRAYAACDYLIERARAACRRVGARLVVVTIPHPLQLTPDGCSELARLSGRPDICDESLPDTRLAAACARHHVPFLAGMDYLTRSDYKRLEGIHWNELGHRHMAAVVREAAQAAGATGRTHERPPVALADASAT